MGYTHSGPSTHLRFAQVPEIPDEPRKDRCDPLLPLVELAKARQLDRQGSCAALELEMELEFEPKTRRHAQRPDLTTQRHLPAPWMAVRQGSRLARDRRSRMTRGW